MKECRGQITLVGIDNPYIYYLDVTPTVIKVNTNGTISEGQDTIICVAKQNNGTQTVQLGSDKVTIGYTTSADSSIKKYPETGVKVDPSLESITFYLYLFANASLSDNYYTSITVPVMRDGQVDANFDVWRGTVEIPLPSAENPSEWNDPATSWKGDVQKLEAHLGDYYISPTMRYYKFVKQSNKYIWIPIHDKILEDWLARAGESTQCFILDDNETLEHYFTVKHPDLDYHIGDLAVTRNSAQNGDHAQFVFNQQWFCRSSKFNVFKKTDWITADEVKQKLKEVGIDLDEYTVTITADQVVLQNTAGQIKSIASMYGDDFRIKSEHITLDSNVTVEGSFTSVIADNIEGNLLRNSSFNYDVYGWSII